MILSKRSRELIEGMCDRYEQAAFVDGSFLREYNVSSKETLIFDTVATLLRGVMRLPDSEIMKLIALGAGTPMQVAQDMRDQLRMKELCEEMDKIKA